MTSRRKHQEPIRKFRQAISECLKAEDGPKKTLEELTQESRARTLADFMFKTRGCPFCIHGTMFMKKWQRKREYRFCCKDCGATSNRKPSPIYE